MKNKGKISHLHIRIGEEEKALLTQAAQLEGYLELSLWVRQHLLQQATQILKKHGVPPVTTSPQ
jgi:uncharacterized protein (DUF1778 family)